MSSTRVSIPSTSAIERPSRSASGEQSRSGMNRPRTLSLPNARTLSAATTALSTPPEIPITAPRRRKPARTWSRSAPAIRAASAAGSSLNTCLSNNGFPSAGTFNRTGVNASQGGPPFQTAYGLRKLRVQPCFRQPIGLGDRRWVAQDVVCALDHRIGDVSLVRIESFCPRLQEFLFEIPSRSILLAEQEQGRTAASEQGEETRRQMRVEVGRERRARLQPLFGQRAPHQAVVTSQRQEAQPGGRPRQLAQKPQPVRLQFAARYAVRVGGSVQPARQPDG